MSHISKSTLFFFFNWFDPAKNICGQSSISFAQERGMANFCLLFSPEEFTSSSFFAKSVSVCLSVYLSVCLFCKCWPLPVGMLAWRANFVCATVSNFADFLYSITKGSQFRICRPWREQYCRQNSSI